MQDPNADTEWNDVLRSKGILPPKEEKEITEDDIVQLVEETVEEKSKAKGMDEMTLEELDEEEDEVDEEEERLYQEYRRRRMAEMKAAQMAKKFGSVTEITKADYVSEVNNAGEGIWVILHVYKQGIPLCSLVNQFLERLAQKFPESKFLKSISDLCIPNYPDKNLPSIFVYFEGDLKKQFIGPLCFGGMNLKQDELEYMLGKVGAIKSDIEEPPKKEVEDILTRAIRQSAYNDDDGDD